MYYKVIEVHKSALAVHNSFQTMYLDVNSVTDNIQAFYTSVQPKFIGQKTLNNIFCYILFFSFHFDI